MEATCGVAHPTSIGGEHEEVSTDRMVGFAASP